VILTDAETEEAAARLVKSSVGKVWSDVPDNQKHGYRMIVTRLAAELDTPKTPEAVFGRTEADAIGGQADMVVFELIGRS
jgi:hypothetical protein